MVFGLFEDRKMTITLDKKAYSAGESINGKIKLEMKKPAPGERLSVRLIYFVPNEDYTKPAEKEFVAAVLGSSREYQTSEFDFSIKIPEKPPAVDFPPASDPSIAEAWKRDDALGLNCFSVVCQLDIRGQKGLTKQEYIKIKYYAY